MSIVDPKKLNNLLRKADGEINPTTASHNELMNQTDLLGEIKDNLNQDSKAKVTLELPEGVSVATLKGEKGNKGDTGEKGEQGIEGEVGQDGTDGVDGIDGKDGINGKDGLAGKDGTKGEKGEKGDMGKDGKDGQDSNPEDVINLLKKDKSLDISHLRNSEQITGAIGKLKTIQDDGFLFNGKKYKIEELMHGGGTGGGNTPPGGNVNDVQLNDGVGGFTGSDNLQFAGGFLTVNGDSGYGQILLTDTPATSLYGGLGINGADSQIIVGALQGDLSIWNGQAINFSADTGNTKMLSVNPDSTVTIPNLGGGASQFVVADNSGTLHTVADPGFATVALDNLFNVAINTDLIFAPNNPRQLTIATQTITDTDGDTLTVIPGTGNGIGNGGTLIIQGGQPGATGNGGNVRISGGIAGAGIAGTVSIYDAGTGYNAFLDTTGLVTADRTFSFPDKSGTFALTSDIAPGGLNLQVQYNNGGVFGGITGAVTNGTILNLTNPLIGGATITTSTVNGVTLTTGGSATAFLNGAGSYTAPIILTTTGTTGVATFIAGTLNIPNYTYTLPTASTSVLGGVKVDGTSITISGGVISATTGGSGTVTSVASADSSITVTNPTTTVDLSVATAPAGALTGTTLKSTVVTSSLTSVGTLGGLTVTAAPTFSAMTAGSVLFAGTAGLLSQDNANLFWDDGNNRLGIGTATPAVVLDIVGTSIRQSNATADATNKAFRFQTRNFTNAQNDFLLVFGQSKTSANTLIFGGGQTGSVAATTISFFTGAGNNTDTGTARLTIDATGNITVPILTASKVVFTDSSKNLTSTGIGTSSQFIKGDGSLDSSTYITGNQTITLSGDVTGSGTTAITTTLATVNGNVGSFGSATQVGTFTVNGKGLITAASSVTITPAASSITGGAALTKTDDTNVTLTLGGTPASSLLAATSLTLGWTGTLGISRGGTGQGTKAAAFDALSPMTAQGDIIYGGTSGTGTRLALGSAGFVLTSDITGVPKWATPAAAALAVGTSVVTGGTSTRVLFDNAGVVGEYVISGSGNVAMTTSPVFTTPTLGVASATTINKVTITAPATGSTLTIQDGFTLTANGNATVSGTNTGDQNLFSSVVVSGQTTVTPASTTQALTLVAGTNVTITTDNTAKSITINASGGSGSPGGLDTQVQFNDGGSAFGGNSGLTFNKTTQVTNSIITDAGTNTTVRPLIISHASSGTAANSLGVGMTYQLQNSGGTMATAGAIDVDWTAGTNTSEMRFTLDNAGALSTYLVLSPGVLRGAAAGATTIGTGSIPFSDLFFATGKKIDWNNGVTTLTHSTNTLTIAGGGLVLAAGTTAKAPLQLTSGTNLTTAAAGAMEYDGKVIYGTSVASSRQVVDTEQFISLTGAYTLTSQTAAQPLFNSTTNGALTAAGTTSYYFECMFTLTSLSASSGSFGFGFGGTATLTSQAWEALSSKGTSFSSGSTPTQIFSIGASTTLVTANTNTIAGTHIKGIVRVNAAGTLIPQVNLGVAAAAVVGVNSWFRLWPIGTNTVTNVGNWS